jgi:hypothetical protein
MTELYKKGEVNAAYKLVLKESPKDDFPLLRLALMSGPVVRNIDEDVAHQVLQKVNAINRAGVFEKTEIEWIDDIKRARMLDHCN